VDRTLISFDWAIKKILRSKANFGILEGFLSELLFTNISILEVLESESNQDTEVDKFNRVDIKVKDNTGKVMIIEVQYSRELDYLHRILYASSKTIVEHMHKGASYDEVSKVISVSILYFVFGEGDDYIYHGTTRFIGVHNNTELQLTTEQQKLYQITTIPDIYPEHYLIELKNFDNIAKTTLDEWIYFLKNEQVKDGFTAKGLEQAKDALDILKMDAKERWAYEQYQKHLHHQASLYKSTYTLGKIEGREEGKQEGIQAGVRLTARNMKNRGIEVATIAAVTGLSVTEIDNL